MLRPVFDMLIMSVIQSSSMNLLLMSANIYQDFIMGGQHAEHLHQLQTVRDVITPFHKGETRGNREVNGTPLQYSCLENPMDGEAWQAAVHGVEKSWTRLSDFTFTFHFHALDKEMVTHSSVFAWRTPGTEKPGGLPSMGSHRVGHD